MATRAITAKVDGLQTTLAALRQFPPAVQKRVLPKAVRAAGAPYTKAARQLAPKTNRLLSRSLSLVLRRYKGNVLAIIGQQIGKVPKVKRLKSTGGISGAGFPAPIHLVESKVKRHEITGRLLRFTTGGTIVHAKRVLHPGHPGEQFIRRAAAQSHGKSNRAFEKKAADEIEKEATKLAAKP